MRGSSLFVEGAKISIQVALRQPPAKTISCNTEKIIKHRLLLAELIFYLLEHDAMSGEHCKESGRLFGMAVVRVQGSGSESS